MARHSPHNLAGPQGHHGDSYYGQPVNAQVGHVTGGVQQMGLGPSSNATNLGSQPTLGVYSRLGGGASMQGPTFTPGPNLMASPPSSHPSHMTNMNDPVSGGSKHNYFSSSSPAAPPQTAPTHLSHPSNPPKSHLTGHFPPRMVGETYQASLNTPPSPPVFGETYQPSLNMPAPPPPTFSDSTNHQQMRRQGDTIRQPSAMFQSPLRTEVSASLVGNAMPGVSGATIRPGAGGVSNALTGSHSGPPMHGPPVKSITGTTSIGPPTGMPTSRPTEGMYVTGTPTGGMSGPPTGGMSGPPTGGMSGPPTGGMSGLPTGRMSGPPTGRMSGPPTGGLSGPPTGQMSGPPTAGMSGPPTGGMSGPPTGGMSGPPTGGLSGPPTGGMSGPPTGGMSGPITGGMSGLPIGTLSVPLTGITSHLSTGALSEPPIGGLSAHPTGQLSGPPIGATPDPSTGTTKGPPMGDPARGAMTRLSTTVDSAGMMPATSVTAALPLTSQQHYNSYPSAPGRHLLSRYPAAPGHAPGGRPAGPGLVSRMAPEGGAEVHRAGSSADGGKALSPQVMPPGMSAPPLQQLQQSAADPLLQPIKILEQRNILPSQIPLPPPIVLPGHQGRFAPDHRVFCCTLNAVPATNSLLNKLKLPLAVHLHPYKDMTEKDCPVLNPSGIVRCRSCRAYINPYVTFVDTRHWRCNMCFRPNTLPEDFEEDNYTGHRGDKFHRMELRKSSVEFIAPSEYMVRPPQPCVYYFVVDVSFKAVDSGVLSIFCSTLLEHLDQLPGDARTLVGLLTFDSTLHFYSFNSSLSEPQMMVVCDIEDVFLPCPDSLLVNLKEYKEMFRSLLADIPRIFAKNHSDKTALGSALQAAAKLLHPIGGRVTVVQCSLPNVGPGALKYRDVVPASVKMPTLNMAPASDFYKSLALDCNSQQICVDLFAFSGQFMDLSTIACAVKFSSGQAFYYPDFHHSKKPERLRFQKDFGRYLTRKIGCEAVMRIRCTEGVSLHTFHGNFFVRSTDLLSLPCVNPDLGYTINISIDESLKELGAVCFQAALLYTSSKGERRIRVHSLSLPVSSDLSHIYARSNVLAITVTLANMAVDRAVSSSLGDAREALLNTAVDSGKMYRTNMASSRQASQYILPASLSLLPLFIIALLKSYAFSLSSKVSYDRRVHTMNLIKCMPLDYLLCLVYPRLYATHLLNTNDMRGDDDCEELASPLLLLSSEKLDRYGVYLMDYGLGLYLWVCKDAPSEYLSQILGVNQFIAIPEIMMEVPALENENSQLLRKLVTQIRSSRQQFLPIQVIREDGPHRLLFIEKLVNDRTELGTSYYELLSHIARQQTK